MVRAEDKTLFLGLRPQEVWAEQVPPSLLARTFPIPCACAQEWGPE